MKFLKTWGIDVISSEVWVLLQVTLALQSVTQLF